MKKLLYTVLILSCIGCLTILSLSNAQGQCPASATPSGISATVCVNSTPGNHDITTWGTHINWYSDAALNDPITTTLVNCGWTYYAIYADTTNLVAGPTVSTTGHSDCIGGAAAATAVNVICRDPAPILPNGGQVCPTALGGCFPLYTIPGVDEWYIDPFGALLFAVGGCAGPGIYYGTVDANNTSTGCESEPALLTVRPQDAAPVTALGASDTIVCPNPVSGAYDLVGLNFPVLTPGVTEWYSDSLLTNRVTGQVGPGIYWGINTAGACASTPFKLTVEVVPTAPVLASVDTCTIDDVNVAAIGVSGAGVATTFCDLNWYSDANLTVSISTAGCPATLTFAPGTYYATYGSGVFGDCESASATYTVKQTPDTLVAWNCFRDPGPVGPLFTNDCNAINASYCENMPPTMADVENIVKMNPTYDPMADSLCWFGTMADAVANMNSITNSLGASLAALTPVDAPDTASIDTYYVAQWVAGCQSHPTMVIVRVNASPMPIWALRGDAEKTVHSGYESTGDTTICPGQPPINLADMVTDTLMGIPANYISVANTTVLEWRFYNGEPGNGGVLIDVVDALPNGWPDPADPDYPVEVHPVSDTITYYAEVMHKIDAFVDPECVANVAIRVIVAPAPMMAAIPDVKVCSDDSFNIVLTVADVMGGVQADFTYAVDVVVDGGLVPLGTSPLTGSLGIIPGAGLADHAYENKTCDTLNVTYTITPIGLAPLSCRGDTITVVATVCPEPVGEMAADTTCSIVPSCLWITSACDVNINGSYMITNIDIPAGLDSLYAPMGTFAANAGTDSLKIEHKFRNETVAPITVTYTLVPTGAASASCEGEPFTATIVVDPAPWIPVGLTDTICSRDSSNVAVYVGLGSLNAIAYKWEAPSFMPCGGTSPCVSGCGEVNGGIASNGNGSWVYLPTPPIGQLFIRDEFVNTTGIIQTAVYRVIALGDTNLWGCESDTVDVKVTIYPEPVTAPLDTFDLCTDGSYLNIDDATPIETCGSVVASSQWFRDRGSNVTAVNGVQTVSNGDIFYIGFTTIHGCMYYDTLVINLDEAPLMPTIPNPVVCADTIANLVAKARINLWHSTPGYNGIDSVRFGNGSAAPGAGDWYAGVITTGTPIDMATADSMQWVTNGQQFTYKYSTDPDGDGNICDAMQTITVTVNDMPTAVLTGGGTICPLPAAAPIVQATFTGLGPWTVSWTDGTTTTSGVVVANNPWTLPGSGTTAGHYQILSIVDQNTCNSAAPSNSVNVNASGVTAVCRNQIIALSHGIIAGVGLAQIDASNLDGGSTNGCLGTSGNLQYSASQSTFHCSDVGSNAVQLYVVDPATGSRDTCTAYITVVDNLKPVIYCPDYNNTPSGYVFKTDPGECYYTVDSIGIHHLSPKGITDNCSIAKVWYTFTACDSNFTHEFAGFTGAYGAGNVGMPPMAPEGTNVPFYPTAQYYDGPNTISLKGVKLPKGNYDITWHVEDEHGNIDSCSFNVEVQDKESPVFTYVTSDTIDIYSSSLQGVDFGCKAAAPDTIHDKVNPACKEYTYYGSFSDTISFNVKRNIAAVCGDAMPFNGAPLWDTTIHVLTLEDNCTADITSGTDLSLAFGPTCTPNNLSSITFTATDCGGNTTSATIVIRILDDEAPVVCCPVDTTINCDVAGNIAPSVMGWPMVYDNSQDPSCPVCPLDTVWNDVYSTVGSCDGNGANGTGTITRTFTITDKQGNVTTCSYEILIQDTTKPVLFSAVVGYADTVCVIADHAVFNTLADWNAFNAGNYASDNCGLALATFCLHRQWKSAGTCPQYVYREYGIKDSCGNMSDLVIDSFVVGDFVDPTITAPADITIDCDASQMPANTGMPLAADNCSFQVTHTDASTRGNDPANCNYYNYTITRTFVVTDTCNRTDNDDQVITVQDTMAPVFGNCPAAPLTFNTSADGTSGDCNYTASSILLMNATDNCAGVGYLTYTNSGDPTYGTGANIGGSFSAGTHVVTINVADPCGNDTDCVVTIVVTDDEDPMIACVTAPVTIYLSADSCAGVADITVGQIVASYSDNCMVDTVIVNPDNVDCSDLGTVSVTATVTDTAGNSAACNINVTVVDNIKPVMLCQNITVYLDNVCYVGITPADVNNGSYDNCTCPLTNLTISQSVFDADDLTRPAVPARPVWLAGTDGSGNVDSCVSYVTVKDTLKPVITCFGDIIVDAPRGLCSRYIIVPVPSTGDNCLIQTLLATWNIGGVPKSQGQAVDNFPVGVTAVRYTVIDKAGNDSSCVTNVVVRDVENPVANCNDITVSLDANGDYTIVQTDLTALAAGSTDNCGVDSLAVDPDDFDCGDLGANAVVVTVWDKLHPELDVLGDPLANIPNTYKWIRNSDDCNATITVQDVIDPTCTAQDITLYLDAAGQASITPVDVVTNTADNCSVVDSALSQSMFTCADLDQSGSTSACQKMTDVTVTVTDQSGNTGTCDFEVTLRDTIPPTPTCKQNVDILLDQNGLGVVTVDSVKMGSVDNCGVDVANETVSPTSFSCGDVGAQTVTYTTIDFCGNIATCVATVDVRDEVSPIAICKNPTVYLDATGNGSITVANVDNGSWDSCGIVTYAVTPNTFDCSNVGVNMVQLRVDDAAGNFAICVAVVTVVDTVSPDAQCVADFSVDLDNTMGGLGSVSIATTDIDNGSTDACGLDPLVISITGQSGASVTFDCSHLGVNTVTLTVTDVNGNVSTCTTDVTVNDPHDPVITVADVTVCNETDRCDSTIVVTATADDNCTIVTTTWALTTNPSCGVGATTANGTGLVVNYTFPVGTTSITFYAEDQSGNSDTQVITVTVNDCQAPVFDACPGNQTLNNVTGDCYNTVSWIIPEASDNCPSFVYDPLNPTKSVASVNIINIGAAGGQAIATVPVGTTTITYNVTDCQGNSTDCAFNIVITDNEAPIINVNGVNCATNPLAPITVTTDPGTCDAQVILPSIAATDNCPGLTLVDDAPSGNRYPAGTTIVTWTATDGSGLTATCQQVIVVLDNQPPSLTCPSNISVNNDPGACSANVDYASISGGVVGSDNCSPYSGFAGFFNSAMWSFSNGAGDGTVTNFGADSIAITTSNTGLISSTVVTLYTVTVDGDGMISFDWDYHTDNTASFFDRFGYAVNGSFTQVSRDNGFGTGLVDQNGNESLMVQAGDLVSLVAVAFDDRFGRSRTVVSNFTFTAMPRMTAGLASGSSFPVGATTVSHTLSDLAGNAVNCSFDVTVIDTEVPVVNCPADITVNAAQGACTAAVTVPTVTAFDNCGSISTSQTLQSENFNTVGAGVPAGWLSNYFGTNANANAGWHTTLNSTGGGLAGPGRIDGTPFAMFCDDSLGLGSVNDSGMLVTPAIDVTGKSGLTLAFDFNYRHGSFDGNGFPSTTESYFRVDVYDGTNWIPVLFRDASDVGAWNVSGIGPKAASSIDVSAYANTGFRVRFVYSDGGGWNWFAGVDNYALTATQMTALNDFNNTADASDTYPAGTTTVTYTATDASGNTGTCSFDVTVVDQTIPTITCPADVSLTAGTNCSVQYSYTAPVGTDNCPGPITTHQGGLGAANNVYAVGVHTESWLVVDASGNTATCSFTITVTDNQNPTITNCPTNITVCNDTGDCGAVVTWNPNGIQVGDNCTGNGSLPITSTHNSGDNFVVGTTTVTYTVTDLGGNNASCSFDVTVNDCENPVVTCPANITMSNDLGLCSAVVTFAATVTDNCGATVAYTPMTSGDAFPVGTTTVTATATDAAGNSVDCTFDVTVNDTENPLIVCPADVTMNNDAGVCGAQVTVGTPTVGDNCPLPSGSVLQAENFDAQSQPSGWGVQVDPNGSGGVDPTNVGFMFTDNTTNAGGNPGNINGSGMAIYCDDEYAASDDSKHTLTAPAVDASAATALILSLDYNYRHTGSGEFAIEVYNGTSWVNVLTETSTSSPGGSWNGTGSGPAAHADIDVSAHANANFQARFIFDDGSGWVWWVAIDNYMLTTGTPSVANDFNGTDNASGSYPVGTTTVTWTVTDASGNTANCTTDVTVNDVENPVVTCPADITVGNDAGICGAVVAWSPATVADNCPGASVTARTHASGDNFAVGTTTVTITATDASGNTGTCDFDVTVNDTENPVVTCPADMTVGNDAGVCEAVVTYTMPTATDNCDGTLTPSLTAGMASGATFPVGTTTVTYSATDAAGNTGDCSFDVTVEDREAPVITCPADQTVSNDPGLCSATFTYTITATDNCSQNVPVFTFGQNVGPVFPTGVVTIMGVATDGAGNSDTCRFQVTVLETEAPVITCPANITVGNDAGNCSAVVNYAVTATDNCPGPINVAQTNGSTPSGSTFAVGTHTLDFTATDGVGNTSNCSFTITVNDTEAPVVSCPANITVSNDAGQCDADVTWAAATISDNCAGASITGSTHASGDNFPVGTTTVTVSGVDAAGNTADCSFDVTVNDTEDPTIVCPADQNVTAVAANNCLAVVTWNAATAGDNCGVGSITQTAGQASGSSFSVGTHTVTYTATDIHGNTASCDMTITVEGPAVTATITTQGPRVQICASGSFVVLDAAPLGVGETGMWTASPSAGVSFSPSANSESVGVTFPATAAMYTMTWTVTNCGGDKTDAATIEVEVKAGPTINISGTNPTSAGLCNGDASAPAGGGTFPYNWLWSDGQTGYQAVGLCAGTYTVILTDGAGCQAFDTITLVDPAIIQECEIEDYNRTNAYSMYFDLSTPGSITGGCATGGVYTWRGGHGTITRYANGEARIIGEIYDTCDANKRWVVDIWLVDQQYWSTYQNTGNYQSSYPGVGTDYTNWEYYELDGTRSHLWGHGDFAGETLDLTHYPASGANRWQIGSNGANDKDGDFGISGWFDYTSSSASGFAGRGGMFADFANCQVPRPGVNVRPVALLEGAFDTNSGMMSDGLRAGSFLPATEPYTGLGYAHVAGGGGEAVGAGVLAATGADAIVDYVIVELRDATDPRTVIASRSALLQRDGDVVDMDGTSAVFFANTMSGDYYVAVIHRNHLGVMLANPVAVVSAETTIDFSSVFTSTYGSSAQKLLSGGRCLLYGGDADFNGQDQNTDDVFYWIPTVGQQGYRHADYNLDGQVQNGDRQNVWTPNAGRGTNIPQ